METTIALLIFATTYIFIVFEKINRAIVSLLGAISIILLGIVDIDKAFTHYIDWNTISLLVGMMLLVGITNRTGVFQFLAIKSIKITKGNPVYILIMLSILTAFASALLDNVTTVLLIVPITFFITDILKLNPIPFLISEILSSNIGGTATLIGDPPNIMIGSANPYLTFNQFIFNLAPVVIIILGVVLTMLFFIYKKQLTIEQEDKIKLMTINENIYLNNPKLLKQSLFILTLTLIGFLFHSLIHLKASLIAIGGATILMGLGLKKEEVEQAFREIEWTSIFFFIGLFALIGGLQEVGIIKILAGKMLYFTDGNIPLAASIILWGSGLFSAIIDNIPFVATMIPLIQEMATNLGLPVNSTEINSLWWSLALGACLGGNGSIIGASANVIVASIATQKGHSLRYMDFLKIGVPITITSLIIAHLYIYYRYFL